MEQNATKPKKIRPTWAMVRELQSQLQELKGAYQIKENEIASLKKSVSLLESSNALMDVEIKRLRCENESMSKSNDTLQAEVMSLRSRGFLARVFNMD